MAAPIQITLKGVEHRASEAREAALRARLARRGVVRLPGFLAPDALAYVQQRLAGAYTESPHQYGTREVPVDGAALGVLALVMRDPRLFAFVERVTGCGPIGRITGGVYRSLPLKHELTWHGDQDVDARGRPRRVAAMTVNLSPKPFRGGALMVKRTDSPRVIAVERYKRAGEAMLMDIDDGLRHRATKVLGSEPKTIFACFFYAEGV